MAVVNKKILVVDDEADARASFRGTLEDRGFNVVEAVNGREALHYLTGSEAAPDLILLDLRMPGMTGWELVLVLRAYLKLAQIPIVVTTGVESFHDLIGAGIAAYLRKPVKDDELFTTIDAALKKSDARQLAPLLG